MLKKLKKINQAISDGPDWVKVPDLLTHGEYRSPTVLLASWIYAIYIRLFTLPGRMIVIIAPLIVFYTLLSVRTPIRILAFAIVAIFLVDIFFGFIFRPKLKIKREAPPRARAGSEVKIEYVVTNKRRFPVIDLEIDPYFHEKGLRFGKGPAAVNMIEGRGKQQLSCQVSARRRGLYTLQKPIAESRFPLALIKWSSRDGYKQKLHVYPAFESLYELNLPVGKRFQKEGVSKVSKVGESMDFAGCRDFRSGDDPRHIHWSSSARCGRLVVKEYQEEYLSRVAVIVDTFIKRKRFTFKLTKAVKPEYPQLEAAVSITAALADYLARGDFVIDFFAAGPEVYHFQGGRSLSCLDSILDILACIEPNHEKPLDDISPILMEEVTSIGSAVVVLLEWNEERKAFLDKLRSHGVSVKILLISDQEDEAMLPDNTMRLSPDDILSGNVRRL